MRHSLLKNARGSSAAGTSLEADPETEAECLLAYSPGCKSDYWGLLSSRQSEACTFVSMYPQALLAAADCQLQSSMCPIDAVALLRCLQQVSDEAEVDD